MSATGRALSVVSAEESKYPDTVTGETGDADISSESEYPPDTHRLLSWSAIRFIQAPSSRILAMAVVLISAIALLTIVLSHFIVMDITVEGTGELAADQGMREAASAIDGFVTELKKEVGDSVAEGDIIAVMATDGLSESEVSTIKSNLELLLQAASNTDSPDTLVLPELHVMVGKIYDSEVLQSFAAIEQQIRTFSESKQQALVGLMNETQPLEARLKVLSEKVAQMSRSKKKQFLQFYIESTNEEVGRLRSQIATSRNNSFNKLNQSLTGLVHSIRVALGTFESYHAKHQILAPIAGKIVRMDVGPNTAVTVHRVIATIIPGNSRFISHIKIASKDIAHVKAGQKVYYKVEAYPYQTYGAFEGIVESFDLIRTGESDSTKNPDSGSLGSFFANGSIAPPSTLSLEVQKQLKFIWGMGMTATIVIDRQPISSVIYKKLFPN